MGQIGRAIGKRGKTSAAEERVEAAANKVDRLTESLAEIETELAEDLTAIDTRWAETAQQVTTTAVSLERTDVKVTHLVLAWIPVR